MDQNEIRKILNAMAAVCPIPCTPSIGYSAKYDLVLEWNFHGDMGSFCTFLPFNTDLSESIKKARASIYRTLEDNLRDGL